MLTVVGSIAFDSVETPFGKVERELGGSAVYSALAASHFTKLRAVGPVGDDFRDEHYDVLENAGVDTGGVQAVPGRQTFSWRGRYDFALSAESLETNLNAFDGWRPRLATEARHSSGLFLAAMDPETQIEVRGQALGAGCVALDSMTYWIRTKRDALVEAIRGVDVVLMNDHEARELTEQPMLLKAAREIASWGPRAVVLRLGEYGCALLSPGGFFSLPGYPLEQATDPTGSGDAFAGGFLGYLDLVRGNWDSDEALRRAVTYGCVMSSFCYEDFGVRRLTGLSAQEIDYRFTDFRQMTHFESVPLHPRPRDTMASERPDPLERPHPTPTTGPRQAPGPTAGTPVYRAPGRTPSTEPPAPPPPRVDREPHAFRRATLPLSGRSDRSPFQTSPFAGNFLTSSPDRGRLDGPGGGSGRQEQMLYCVVAGDAPRKVGEALARQYEDDPTIRVIVERRGDSRRELSDRRRGNGAARHRVIDRRQINNPDGRRVAERRALLGPSFRQLALPRAARGHEDKIVFGSPIPQPSAWLDDVTAARLALEHQAGDTRAFESLYELWFDRTYTFMRTVTGQSDDVEEAVNVAFTQAFDRLATFSPAHTAFRVWMGGIIGEIALSSEHDIDGEQAETRILDRWVGPADLDALSWLRDDELLVLVRQLPSPQREVVSLRYVLGLDPEPVADILGIDDSEVHELHDRALRFMSGCLTSLSRRPGYSGRLPAVERRRYYPVTTGRKRALAA